MAKSSNNGADEKGPNGTAQSETTSATANPTSSGSSNEQVKPSTSAPGKVEPKADPGEGYRFKAVVDAGEKPIFTNNPRYAKSLHDRGAQVIEINRPKFRDA